MRRRRLFTLIEVMIVIILMGVLGGVAAFSLRPLYQSFRFRLEADALYELLQELQIEALSLQSDMSVTLSKKDGKWRAQSKSDETIIKNQTIDLSHIEEIENASQITIYSNGVIDPPQLIKLTSKGDQRWIDCRTKHLIKFLETAPPTPPLEKTPNIIEIRREVEKMKIISSAFKDHGAIPEIYTCEGKNINPPLQWTDVPSEAVSCVLIMDDPDVPAYVRKDQMWVHWVVYDIPPTITHIAENSIPPGIQGRGTGGEMQYQGPCPPDREHRYFFKLYALDTLLKLKPGATKEEIEKSMASHIIAKTELVGVYCKKENRPNSSV